MMTVNEIIDKFNVLLASGRDEIVKFCFYLLDANEDGKICLKDVYDTMAVINTQNYFT